MKPYEVKGERITFLDNRFYLAPDGNFLPSATTILDCYPKGYQFYEWLKKNGEDSDVIRDEAGRRGTRVHDLTERYDRGEEICLLGNDGKINMRMSEWHMFEKYVEFRNKNKTNVIHNELSIASATLGFAGTLDRVMDINDKRFLIDIKTSNYISQHYWLQLAAYRELLREVGIEVDAVGILWLNAKTRSEGRTGQIQGEGWQLIMQDNKKGDIDKNFRLFRATKVLWEAENGGMKPRELSYSIKHKLSI